MQLVLSEDQELIAKTAADFVSERSPVSRVRELRDREDARGYSAELWKEMAELGWVGIPIPEPFGGAGLGLADLSVVLEALGRELAPEPFLSTVLLGARAIATAGRDEQQAAWLPEIASGERILSLAYQERHSRYDVCAVETRAEAAEDGYRIDGEKVQVLDGHIADGLIVSARTSGTSTAREGISLFVVDPTADGVERIRQQRVDTRNAAIVRLRDVRVPAAALLGDVGGAAPILEDTVDYATAGLCAEMLGGMLRAFEMTLDHLKERKQFGVPVGSFQALKHRAADVFVEIELAKSTSMAATRAIDDALPNAAELVSLAKARCSDAFMHTANEAVQMFGGVGMTDEYDIGFYLKRARATELTFGDAAFHRDRWARLRSY